MSFGWEIFNALSVQMAGSKKLLRFAYYAHVSANGSATVAGLIAANAVAFALLTTGNYSPFLTITVTDGNVSWSRSTWSDLAQFDVFVMQWK